MFCKNCGKEINATDKFCSSCGSSIEAEPHTATSKTNNALNKKKKDIHIIISYVHSVIILLLRLMLEQEVRWSPSRAVIAYDNMLTLGMKIFVGIIAIGLIVFANMGIKNKSSKQKMTIRVMSLINAVLSIIIIIFYY